MESTEPDANDSEPAPVIATEAAPLVVNPANDMPTPVLIETEEVAEKYAVSAVEPGHETSVPVAGLVSRQVFAASQLPVPPTAVVVAPLASQ